MIRSIAPPKSSVGDSNSMPTFVSARRRTIASQSKTPCSESVKRSWLPSSFSSVTIEAPCSLRFVVKNAWCVPAPCWIRAILPGDPDRASARDEGASAFGLFVDQSTDHVSKFHAGIDKRHTNPVLEMMHDTRVCLILVRSAGKLQNELGANRPPLGSVHVHATKTYVLGEQVDRARPELA